MPQTRSPIRKTTGFSVLELLFTVTLAAIVLTLGVPALQQFRHNRAMSAAISSLHHHLAMARNEAVNLNVEMVSCPGNLSEGCIGSTDWQNGWIMFADLDRDHAHDATETITRYGAPFNGLTVRSTGGRKYLRFSTTGYSPGSNMSIRFCDNRGPGKARKLVVSNLGRIRRDQAPETTEEQCPDS
jgi:type IV fimbrial biogenesis protein FimT